ncbi:MAG: hypothetical protein RLZZ126_365 [Pseudomonadota bacterium]|jgi:sigma-E factor negative regulatory protein RseB
MARNVFRVAFVVLVLVVGAVAHASPEAPVPAERSIADWLARMHEGSRKRAFVGTFVVSSASGMSSSRIWHACDGEQQLERVVTLTGAPRTTLRRNDDVLTLLPDEKMAIAEKRESLGLFPKLLNTADSSIGQHYDVRYLGQSRVAGTEADVIHLVAKDLLRFSYRVWAERKTGLMVKLQTLDTDGKVLEQAAYSELQLDAPVSIARLTKMMSATDGYKVVRPEMVKTTAESEGWVLKAPVPGFKPMGCVKRSSGSADGTMQWVFSDGLASVSVFAEAFDRQRHVQEGLNVAGATRALTRRVTDRQSEKSHDWWLTVVGEVPAQTLLQFAQGLERRK